jgi:hypothetical protein
MTWPGTDTGASGIIRDAYISLPPRWVAMFHGRHRWHKREVVVLGVRFLMDWNGSDGKSYKKGDQAEVEKAVAYDLRTRGVVEPQDAADPQWAQWE